MIYYVVACARPEVHFEMGSKLHVCNNSIDVWGSRGPCEMKSYIRHILTTPLNTISALHLLARFRHTKSIHNVLAAQPCSMNKNILSLQREMVCII